MQDLVYGLVPGVFRREMERRREFYTDHPDPGKKVANLSLKNTINCYSGVSKCFSPYSLGL